MSVGEQESRMILWDRPSPTRNLGAIFPSDNSSDFSGFPKFFYPRNWPKKRRKIYFNKLSPKFETGSEKLKHICHDMSHNTLAIDLTRLTYRPTFDDNLTRRPRIANVCFKGKPIPTSIGIEVFIFEEAVTDEDQIMSISFPRLKVSLVLYMSAIVV